MRLLCKRRFPNVAAVKLSHASTSCVRSRIPDSPHAKGIDVSGKRSSTSFCRKHLTGSVVLLYTRQLARKNELRMMRENFSMMTNWTFKEHAKWQPCAAMYGIVCALSLSLSSVNTFGGGLGQVASIDSRHIRQ